MKNNKLIYLASPYSHPDAAVKAERAEKARRYTAEMIEAGHILFSPIVYGLALDSTVGTQWRDWIAFDARMISACDELWVLMLPGWGESDGVAEEMEIAKDLGIPTRMINGWDVGSKKKEEEENDDD